MKRLLSLVGLSLVAVLAVASAPLQDGVESDSGRVVDTLDAAPACDEAAVDAIAKDSVQECKNGCNKKCSGAQNKSKCVGTCRRACEG